RLQRSAREQDERARVVGHRARDVKEEHQPPAATPASPPGTLDGLASRAERAAKRAAQVRTSFPRRLAATGSAARDVQLQSLHQLREFGELSLAELGEALRPQQLTRAGERDFLLDDPDLSRRRVGLG